MNLVIVSCVCIPRTSGRPRPVYTGTGSQQGKLTRRAPKRQELKVKNLERHGKAQCVPHENQYRSSLSARSTLVAPVVCSSTVTPSGIEGPPGLLDRNELHADIRVHIAVVCHLKRDKWRIRALDGVRAEALGLGPMMNPVAREPNL